jgi:hypothetical protein
MDGFPDEFTAKDTPFVADVKYMDVILRPGNGLFMPAHWFVSWKSHVVATSSEKSAALPMVGTISYHSPVSLLAFHASPFT